MFENHKRSKLLCKEERDRDRNLTDSRTAVVCVDLQNVLTLPTANVKSIFYLRKLAVYNMTGHCSADNKGYCAFWPEHISGRTGNDMSTAIVCILEKNLQNNPHITRFTLWSDNCISQNKNKANLHISSI